LYSKRRYPKVMYKNNPQIQKKETVKRKEEYEYY
jgi:hypothetical protein